MALSNPQKLRMELLVQDDIGKSDLASETPVVDLLLKTQAQQKTYLQGLVNTEKALRDQHSTDLSAAQTAEATRVSAEATTWAGIKTEVDGI